MADSKKVLGGNCGCGGPVCPSNPDKKQVAKPETKKKSKKEKNRDSRDSDES